MNFNRSSPPPLVFFFPRFWGRFPCLVFFGFAPSSPVFIPSQVLWIMSQEVL